MKHGWYITWLAVLCLTRIANAGVVTTPIIIGNYSYSYIRCDSEHGPFRTEAEVEFLGPRTYYNACNDPVITGPGHWGTVAQPSSGTCGSSNSYNGTGPFGIESLNARNVDVSYCLAQVGRPFVDGVNFYRRRFVGCFKGYTVTGSGNGPYTCVSNTVDYNPLKNAGAQCPANGTNPINAATGNKFQAELDIAPIDNGELRFERFYNSNTPSDTVSVASGISTKWRHTYARSVYLLSNTAATTAVVARPEGNAYFFSLTNGTWTPDSDVNFRLTRLTDTSGNPTGWQVSAPDNSVELYDMNGRLQSITDARGRSQTLSYNGNQMTAVTDSLGRSLTFSYIQTIDASVNSYGLIKTITDPTGSVYSYEYVNGVNSPRLSKAIRPNEGGVTPYRQYLYDESGFVGGGNEDFLTGIVDENNQRYATFKYDDHSRAASSEHVITGVDKITITFPSATSSALTDALGATRTYTYQKVLGVAKTSAMAGGPCTSCGNTTSAATYDANGNALSKIDFNGNKTIYTFDQIRNLELTRQEGLNSANSPQPESHQTTMS